MLGTLGRCSRGISRNYKKGLEARVGIELEAFSRRERVSAGDDWEPAAEILRLRFLQAKDLCDEVGWVGLEARVGIEPTYKGFADLSLTTWVPRLAALKLAYAPQRVYPLATNGKALADGGLALKSGAPLGAV